MLATAAIVHRFAGWLSFQPLIPVPAAEYTGALQVLDTNLFVVSAQYAARTPFPAIAYSASMVVNRAFLLG
jgi:hypothetical protein